MPEDRDELSPELREELGSLPRERDPGGLLEERTVRALRARGILHPPRSRWLRPRGAGWKWVPTAAAAAVALFAGGFALGQWTGSRAVADGVLAARELTREQSALETARVLQRAGSDYVMALAALASRADSASNGELEQGREVARAIFYAAARELGAVAPDDPVVARIRQLLAATGETGREEDLRTLVWF